MKVRTSVISILCLAVALSPRAVFAQGGLVRVADNVYAYSDVKDPSPANSFGANAGVVVGTKGAVVVDTLISAKEAGRLLRDVRAVTDKPVRYVVDTHYHLDHAFGNGVFEDGGAVVIAQEKDTAAMKAAGDKLLAGAREMGLTAADLEGTRIAPPTITFGDRLRIDPGGVTVELIFVAPSHTAGSAMAYVRERKVLFTGDILFTDYHPYLGEGDIDGWVRTLDAILLLDVDAIVPGHGPVSTKKDVQAMKEYLLAFDRNARALAPAAKNAQALAAELKKVLPARSRAEFLIPYSAGKYLPAK